MLCIAKRYENNVVLNLILINFCGAGRNIIQLTFTCKKGVYTPIIYYLNLSLVIAVDIDPVKILFAKHNIEAYRVTYKIYFIVRDFFQVSTYTDVVFMLLPWGGLNIQLTIT